ncbi:hypothetical protein LSM04_005679 [Trypanosoma melophagium]|uniref:uncharacterized protein n=1 Tax=Trypanosoma melophagium TaxID=715481 RepID=UPI00351A0C79|nr:hypothetical protein LSM04_005679 [Trypanosoma melophagium]
MNTDHKSDPLGTNSAAITSLPSHSPNPNPNVNANAQQEGTHSTAEGEIHSIALMSGVDMTSHTNATVGGYTVDPTREVLDSVPYNEHNLHATVEMREAVQEPENVNVRRVSFLENSREIPCK